MRPRFPATPLPRLQRCDECGRWELPRPGHTHRRGYGLCVGGIAELTAANRNWLWHEVRESGHPDDRGLARWTIMINVR